MLKKILNLSDVQLLNKNQLKEVNGGSNPYICYEACSQNGAQDGDCCITSSSGIDGLGSCLGLECIPLF
jgi:hypothetical protein